MFGMGFMEILLIAVVAIIALGPEKLPNAMIEIARFIKKLKSGVEDAKSTLDDELNITQMKEEASKYKAQIEHTKNILNDKKNIDLDLKNILNENEKETLSKKKTKKSSKKSKEKPKDEYSTDKFKIKSHENSEENK